MHEGYIRPRAVAYALALALLLPGCTPMTAGQLAQVGYDAAKTSLTGNPANSAATLHARTVMNGLSVGDEVAPVLESMGMPPKEKSGNLQGYVCYQFTAVYSATEDAVIVAREGKIVFFGSSTCRAEMQASNFNGSGKYAPPAAAQPKP